MTRQEKESLIKHLDTVVPKEYEANCLNDGSALWYVSDVKAAIGDFVIDDRDTGINYEAEFKRLSQAYVDLKTIATEQEAELRKLKLIVKTIEFVSGRELDY